MTRLNTHMAHFEDLVLFGKEGLEEIKYKIDNILSDNIIFTEKIDGAPAVICWSHFEGYPDNSICLKSFVKGNNNVISSEEDIIEKYGDRPEMAKKLAYCLELARLIPKGEAWQGDCLYTESTLKHQEILGQEYITFQPNKVIYAVSEDSPAYQKIANSAFGICFHTIYTGNLNNKKQSFKVDLPRLFDVPGDIYIMTPTIERPTRLPNISTLYNKFINLKARLEDDPSYEQLLNNPMFIKYWNLFENKFISDKAVITLDLNTFKDELNNFISNRLASDYEKKQNTLKTDKGREKAKSAYEQSLIDLNTLLKENDLLLTTLVDCLNTVAEIKMKLIATFPTKKDFSTFFNSASKGYITTSGEGIAMSDLDGNVVKLVDRSTFSNANRDDDILRGFSENLNEKLEGPKKLAVVAFGRMNPPTIAHLKLVKTLELTADKNNGDAYLFLSHTQDKKKNPLSYDNKLNYCRKAFPNVNIVDSPAKTLINVLEELNNEYTDIIYVCGSDRLQGEYSSDKVLLAYNNIPDKSGKINYSYNSINFVSAGERNADSEDKLETISASMARELAKEDNFEEFESIVPFDEKDARNLFNDVRRGLGLSVINESLENTQLNIVRKYICSELEKDSSIYILEKRTNSRHPQQLLRIRLDLNNGDKALEKAENILRNIKLESTNYQFVDYSYHPEASGQFSSFEVLLDNDPYFIVVSSKIGKELAPVKLIDNLKGKEIDYLSLPDYIKYDKDPDVGAFLKTLAEAAANNTSCTNLNDLYENLQSDSTTDITFGFTVPGLQDLVNELGSEKFKKIKSGLEVDFAEIYGAISFAATIKEAMYSPVSILYPAKANEKLIDYTLLPKRYEAVRVSAKTKSGAKPSSSSMFESIMKFIETSNHSDSDLSSGVNFAKWFSNDYLSKSVDDGYTFLAETMLDIIKGNGPSWSVELSVQSSLKNIIKLDLANPTFQTCQELRNICNNVISSELNEPSKLYEGNLNKYVVRCLGTLLVDLINHSDLNYQINTLFKRSYGCLVQVYAFPNFETGEFKFIAKWINSDNHHYEFSYNIGLDTASRQFKNNKLAIVAK